MRTSVSASTRTAISDIVWRTLMQVVGVQEDRVDELADDRDGDDRRDQGEVAQPGEAMRRRRRRTRARLGAGVAVGVPVGHGVRHGRGPLLPSRRPGRCRASRGAISRTTRPWNMHQHAVAGAQVVELVGDDAGRRCRAARTSSTTPSRVSLDRTSTPAVGLIRTSSRGLVGQRPGHHHLLLVAAGEPGDRQRPGRAS